jgi:hypothetical protein
MGMPPHLPGRVPVEREVRSGEPVPAFAPRDFLAGSMTISCPLAPAAARSRRSCHEVRAFSGLSGQQPLNIDVRQVRKASPQRRRVERHVVRIHHDRRPRLGREGGSNPAEHDRHRA